VSASVVPEPANGELVVHFDVIFTSPGGKLLGSQTLMARPGSETD
jgi:hypothetical protein